MNIMDFANDDRFGSTWSSNPKVKNSWYEVEFKGEKEFNMIVVADKNPVTITKYSLQYELDGKWKTVFAGENTNRIKIHRFDKVYGNKVRILIQDNGKTAEIAEFGVFNERR